jgi:pyridoxine 5-phosphate synthase
MARLCVCVDYVAALREARRSKEPDPVVAAIKAEMAGADGIVVDLHDDRKNITDRDLNILKEVVGTHLNLGVAAKEDMVKVAIETLPDMVTLMPDKYSDKMRSVSLDIVGNLEYMEDICATLKANSIVVSALIDPEMSQIRAAAKAGFDYVQINTSLFSGSQDLGSMVDELEKIRTIAIGGSKLGLGISAGMGLNYQNIRDIVTIEQIEELNVGFAIISRALMVGIEQAVKDILELVR